MPRKSRTDIVDKIPIREVSIQNYLSFQDANISLNRLNALVGPNGGGKSNFLSVFRFLGEVARTDLVPALNSLFGGYRGIVCRAQGISRKSPVKISVKGEITEHSSEKALDEYSLEIRPVGDSDIPGLIRKETLLLKRSAGRGRRITLSGAKYEYETVGPIRKGRSIDSLSKGTIGSEASALSVLRRIGERSDTEQVSQLADVFEDLRLFDPNVDAARRPANDSENTRLSSSASNLSAVLSNLEKNNPDLLKAIQDDMKYVLPGFKSFHFERISSDFSFVRVGISEQGLQGITPITFASYGTVRAIALFTMLRDPSPPRLTCLEEIDHGLHPHALDILVARLRDASKKSQLIVATHSPALVNRLNAEELIIFEKNKETGVTQKPDITAEQIKEMEKSSGYMLGELWYSGILGGTNL